MPRQGFEVSADITLWGRKQAAQLHALQLSLHYFLDQGHPEASTWSVIPDVNESGVKEREVALVKN